jgi:UDP-N-acetylmuramoylalanine--D-glutamate ligase
LAGGYDKGSDLHPLAEAIVRHACSAAFFGATAEKLLAAVRRTGFQPVRGRCGQAGSLSYVDATSHATLAEAFAWLSPACSSHDQYADFTQRGEEFVELVQEFAARRAQPNLP